MRTPSAPELSGWRKAAARMLDLLYPPACAVCSGKLTHGRALCGDCGGDLPRLAAPFCQTCGEMFQGNIDGPFACPNCSDLSFAFEFARPAHGAGRAHAGFDPPAEIRPGNPSRRRIGTARREAFDDPRLARALAGSWPLVPVPLHRKRLRHRHFNQAEEISRALAKHTGLPVLKALRRTRQTETQTLLSRKQRMENLRGAFEITRHGRRWIESSPDGAVLIDDVLTTGSTVNECAKTLRRAGFRKVFVVTVMRG